MVTSQPGASLGQRYASCCAAMAVAEAVRAKGGHALLVLDDISPLVGAPAELQRLGNHSRAWNVCAVHVKHSGCSGGMRFLSEVATLGEPLQSVRAHRGRSEFPCA